MEVSMKSNGLNFTRGARRVLSCLIPAMLLVVTANAGNATGTVNMVEVSSLGGVFLQLNISPTFNYEPTCPSPSFAFLVSSDPLYSTFLATMLAAQASGSVITVTTSGCVAISGSQQPRIADIQLGTRLPGT
jgi:hypothetical protein